MGGDAVAAVVVFAPGEVVNCPAEVAADDARDAAKPPGLFVGEGACGYRGATSTSCHARRAGYNPVGSTYYTKFRVSRR